MSGALRTHIYKSSNLATVIFQTKTNVTYQVQIDPHETLFKACCMVLSDKTNGLPYDRVKFIVKSHGAQTNLEATVESLEDEAIFLHILERCDSPDEVEPRALQGDLQSLIQCLPDREKFYRVLCGCSNEAILKILKLVPIDLKLVQLAKNPRVNKLLLLSHPEYIKNEQDLLSTIQYFALHPLSDNSLVVQAVKGVAKYQHNRTIANITFEALKSGNYRFVSDIMNTGLQMNDEKLEAFPFSNKFWSLVQSNILGFAKYDKHFLFEAYGSGSVIFDSLWQLYEDEAYGLEVIQSVSSNFKTAQEPLHQAARNKHHQLVYCFLSFLNWDVNQVDSHGDTPLIIACKTDNIETAKLCIDNGAEVNKKDRNGETPVIIACKCKNVELAKLCFDHGAEVNLKNDENPLIIACKDHNIELAKLCIQRIDVNIQDKNGDTPLIVACKGKNVELAKLCIDHGAELNVKNRMGNTLLQIAVESGSLETVQYLIDLGMDITEKDKEGNSLLHYAVKTGKADNIRYLLQNGLDVNEKDKIKQSVLLKAAENGDSNIVQVLIDNGADVNAKNFHNDTPLHMAAKNGHTETCRLLVEAGADWNPKKYLFHKKLLQFAIDSGNSETADYLRSVGCH